MQWTVSSDDRNYLHSFAMSRRSRLAQARSHDFLSDMKESVAE